MSERGTTMLARLSRLTVLQVVALVALMSPVGLGPAGAVDFTSLTCASEAADGQSAAAMAVACGRRVEVVAGRSEYTQVFANPDGTSSFAATAVPARVHHADGTWVPVDLTLHPRPDGS